MCDSICSFKLHLNTHMIFGRFFRVYTSLYIYIKPKLLKHPQFSTSSLFKKKLKNYFYFPVHVIIIFKSSALLRKKKKEKTAKKTYFYFHDKTKPDTQIFVLLPQTLNLFLHTASLFSISLPHLSSLPFQPLKPVKTLNIGVLISPITFFSFLFFC